MIQANEILDRLRDRGFGPFIAIPCSFLRPLINYLIESPEHEYLVANNEGEAVAIAAGAYLSGKKPVVMFQNSGLGNAINPLTSLTNTFRIPLLLIVTWRGEPGRKDEPQHELMGQITDGLLGKIRVAYDSFPDQSSEILPSIDRSITHMENTSLPFALIMKSGSVAPYELGTRPGNRTPQYHKTVSSGHTPVADGPTLTRREAIEQLVQNLPSSAALVGTTGMTSRDLYHYYGKRSGNFYVLGSMGCASSLALGVALYQRNRRVAVLDGDGAALIRLEAMVSIGHYRPENLIHLILDNGVHDSTGGQPTLSATVRFEGLGTACGYATSVTLARPDDLSKAVARCVVAKGPHLIHVLTLPGSDPGVGRPTLTPVELKQRFMAFLLSGEEGYV